MNYETQIKPRLDAGKTLQEIADEINAEYRNASKNWRAVESNEITNWLASYGLSARLENWKAENTAHPAYLDFAAAIDGLLAMRNNVKASLKVAPNSEHRIRLEAAVSVGVITVADLDNLLAVAYTGTDETEESVQGVIDSYNSIDNWWNRVVTEGALFRLANVNATKEEILAYLSTVE